MRNKILLSLILVISFLQPVSAFQGENYGDLHDWVKKHEFLATYLAGPEFSMDYWSSIAFKQLQDNIFVDVRFIFVGQDLGSADSELAEQEVYLAKRAYDPDKKVDTFSDSRPWKNIRYINVWQRDNPKADLLLSKIYGVNLSKDFKNSKLIYQGPEYTEAAPATYYRHEIMDLKYKVLTWSENIKVYLGEDYGYEVSNSSVRGITPYISLKIMPKKRALLTSKVLKKNALTFDKFQKLEKIKNKRNSPANIKIE